MPLVLGHAWRSWKNSPGVALLAILAFAIGIGSTTAIFTVVNGVILKPLPYAEADRFVALYGVRVTEPGQYMASTVSDLLEFERRTTTFDVFGWFTPGSFNLTSPGEPQFVNGVRVTPGLVQNLGVAPLVGRWFTDETGVVISTALWRRLGGSSNIVGSSLTLDNRPYTITGVMPQHFRLPIAGTAMAEESDIWIYLDPLGRGQDVKVGFNFAYARRKSGVSLSQAQADVVRAAGEIAALDPASHPSYTARVVGLRDDPLTKVRATLLVLFGAAGLLLLISAANVATLLVARSVARARETAIHVALGASRARLALRYFIEGSLVSLAGAAVGIVLSLALVRGILVVASDYISRPEEIGIDWKVLGFALAVAFLSSALASLAPLLQAIRTAPNAVLTDGVRASAGVRARRLSRALVVAEIALTFALLTVSVVLIAHLRALNRVSPGFNPDGLLTFQLTVPQPVVSSNMLVAYQKRLIDALAQIPSVGGAAFSNQIPLDGCCLGGTVYPEGRPPTRDARRVSFMMVSPTYFATIGMSLRAGRFLTDADTRENALAVVINQAAVNRYWPNQNPVGAYGRFGRPDGNRFQVVGVAGDIRNDGLNKTAEAELYLLATVVRVNPMRLLIRSPLPASQLIAEVRRAIRDVDATLPVHDVKTMQEVMEDSLQLERVVSLVMTFFAAAALLMATLGVYGVVSYSVRQRTVEIGTRMALGAVPADLLRLIVGSGLKVAALGVGAGAIAVAGGVWLLIRYLEVHDVGSIPFAFSTLVVGGVAVAASYVPAWRATLVSPMVAIRDEPGSAWTTAKLHVRRAIDHVTRAVTASDAPDLSPTVLLTEFVVEARTAESFSQALQGALNALCNRLGVRSAILLERSSDQTYRGKHTVGQLDPSGLSVPADGFLVNRFKHYPRPLPFLPADLDALAVWAAANRPDRLDEIRGLREADVRLAVPVRTKDEILGLVLLGPPANRARFTAAEREALAACADQFALMLENARLTDRVVEQEKLRRDVALAAEVQKRLMPTDPPVADVAEFAAVSLPARSIGGDYYDFIEVGDRRIGIALADVSGKGIAAALIMSVVQASLRIISSERDVSLPRLAARMNHFLYQSTPANKYATFFYAQVDSETRQLRYVNAGHNPPYLVRTHHSDAEAADAFDIQELSVGGAVVGMFPNLDYEEATIDLQSGDVLIAFTDGVTEAQNPGDLEYGEERLKALLRGVAHLPVHEISERISSDLRDWIQDAAQYDDLTFVVMKVH